MLSQKKIFQALVLPVTMADYCCNCITAQSTQQEPVNEVPCTKNLHSPLPRNFFLILDLKIVNCGAFLVHFFAVQLVALHAKSSAYERIEQKAAKQGYWKLIYSGILCGIKCYILEKAKQT